MANSVVESIDCARRSITLKPKDGGVPLFDWAASVRRITVERSLPDPRLTFQSDIADTAMSLMPGLMMDFPSPGKLKAAANVATAESDAKYFLFESSVLQTAFALKKAHNPAIFFLWRSRRFTISSTPAITAATSEPGKEIV